MYQDLAKRYGECSTALVVPFEFERQLFTCVTLCCSSRSAEAFVHVKIEDGHVPPSTFGVSDDELARRRHVGLVRVKQWLYRTSTGNKIRW